MRLTRAQRRVLRGLCAGGRLWLVASGEEDPEAHQCLGVFRNGEFLYEWRPQARTLISLRRLGFLDGDLDGALDATPTGHLL